MNLFKQYIVLLPVCFISSICFGQQQSVSKYLSIDKNGMLQYLPDSLGNIIPDFSRVGYPQEGQPMPVVENVKILRPAANSQQLIQEAIDEVAVMPLNKNGFRGAIFLEKGIYNIPGTLNISTGGIVLRGETDLSAVLVATGKGQRSLIAVSGNGKRTEIKGSRRKIMDRYVPSGVHSFTINNTLSYKTGDSIIVFRPGTEKWISDLRMDKIAVRDSNTRQWTAGGYDLHFERVITKIEGNKIFIDNPVVMAMEEKYGGGEIYKYTFNGRISNIGIEHLLCESEYSFDTDEDHGWNAIYIDKTQNAWVDNVRAVHFGYSCVNLGEESRNILVFRCSFYAPKSKIEGGRRYSFNNDGQMNLFMSCYASEGRHDYVTGAKTRGPNVFTRCVSENAKADIGPHHRWAMGTLYDNIVTDGEINAQDRGNWGTGHGWSGVNQVFFNCKASRVAIQDPWVSGKNYVICMDSTPYDGRLQGRNASAWFCAEILKGTSLFNLQYSQHLKQVKKKK